MKSTSESVTMTIGEAAGRLGLPTHVLRYWESLGLVSPHRRGDRRYYDEDDLFRIAVVVRAKQAGLSLEDIGELYRASGNEARHEILRQHRSRLRERIAEARAALDLVDHALACDHEEVLQCPKFQAAVTDLIGPPTTTT